MLHIMLDAYNCLDLKMNDMRGVYEVVSRTIDVLGVDAVMPPIVVPYYYGVEKADDGLSAFVLLRGGHMTIHTFPERQCYFVDMLYDGFFSEEKFKSVMQRELPFDTHKINIVDRRFNLEEQQLVSPIDKEKDFGPHYLIQNVDAINLDFDRIYSFLDNLPPSINMTPITRPTVVTDNCKKPSVISGLTMIAQSHVALHYDISKKSFFADIFSCSFIDCNNLNAVVEDALGINCKIVLISRGSKHTNRLPTREEMVARGNKWREKI